MYLKEGGDPTNSILPLRYIEYSWLELHRLLRGTRRAVRFNRGLFGFVRVV